MTQQNPQLSAQTAANTNSQQYTLTPVSDSTPVVIELPNELSGPEWIHRFPTSTQTSELHSPFRENTESFISALEAAGATVHISATFRPPERAFLMHPCAKIADGLEHPANVPTFAGVNIEWIHRDTHGQIDLPRSRQAARAMKNGYGIVYPPALASRHTEGRAIDMTISNHINRTVRNGLGQDITITSSGTLYLIGATYNVRKLLSDPPHWSDDGH